MNIVDCDSNIGDWFVETKQEKEERLRENAYFRECKEMETENVFLKEVLANVLLVLIPMAKGYAVEHPVGKNIEMVQTTENTIKVALGNPHA